MSPRGRRLSLSEMQWTLPKILVSQQPLRTGGKMDVQSDPIWFHVRALVCFASDVVTDTDCILTRPELSIEERRRREKVTPRIAIRKHPHSSFLCLFDGGDEQATLKCCRVDHCSLSSSWMSLNQISTPIFQTPRQEACVTK